MRKKGMTNGYLADRIEEKSSTVAHWTNGRRFPRSADTIVNIAHALGASVALLFGETNDNESFSYSKILLEDRCKEKSYTLVSKDKFLNGMYAVKIISSEMNPKVQEKDICYCVPINVKEVTVNMLVHYNYKTKSGIRTIHTDEESKIICLVPLNIEGHKVISILEEDIKYLKISKITGFTRYFD